jgi:hypothetical protein
MEVQPMLELLLKEVRAWGEKIDAETRATQARTKAIEARTAAMRDKRLKANMNASQEETTACQDAKETNPKDKADVVDGHKIPNEEEETMACQGMEARLEDEEPTSVDMKPEVAQDEKVRVKDATVMPVREPEKEMTSSARKETMACQEMEVCLEEERTSVDKKPEAADQRGICGSRMKLAAACRNIFRKSSTQRNCGPRKEVTATGIKITRCPGHRNMGQTENNVV